jgi:gliding motility-associated lipoprotein GldH
MYKKFIGFCLVVTIAFSCNTLNVYEQQTAFKNHQWQNSNSPSFNFTITDTAAAYNIFIIVRHTQAYRYSNLFLNITTKNPIQKTETQQLEIVLADNKKGWLGTGMDDIFTHRVRITKQPITLLKGNYTFTLQQTMRENPLQQILNAGIRVEKVQ